MSTPTPAPNGGINRRYPRYRSDFRVGITGMRAHEAFTIFGRCTVFSEGGMGGVMAGEMEVGDVVSVDFALPTGDAPFNLRAVVRRCTGLFYGLEFISLTPQERKAIREYCKTLARTR